MVYEVENEPGIVAIRLLREEYSTVRENTFSRVNGERKRNTILWDVYIDTKFTFQRGYGSIRTGGVRDDYYTDTVSHVFLWWRNRYGKLF